MQSIKNTLEKQKAFYKTGATRDVNFRIAQLKKLKQALILNENNLQFALMHF